MTVMGSRFGPYTTRAPGEPRNLPGPPASVINLIDLKWIGYFYSSISTLSRYMSPATTGSP